MSADQSRSNDNDTNSFFSLFGGVSYVIFLCSSIQIAIKCPQRIGRQYTEKESI